MRIGIDARFLTHPQLGGFKTYSENLIAALITIDPSNEYVLYTDRPLIQPLPVLAAPNVCVRVVPGELPLVGMPWREQVALALRAAKDRLDLFHAPNLTAPLRLNCPLVVTIHDMIWRFPEKFGSGTASGGKRKLMQWYYQFVPQLAARQAAAVITVSHAARASICEHLGLPAERVIVTHEAAKPIYRQLTDTQHLSRVRQAYGLNNDFILAIGSADPRKNLVTLLHAYAALPEALRQRYDLAIVWTHRLLADVISSQATTLGIRERLRFLERVSDDDLVALYNSATLFVFPSRYEGFGLPLLEAMACGAAVVAADNSSIPEIVGDAALLVGANDISAMSAAMGQVLSNPSLRSDLIARGLERAAGFSWEKCARETLAVYQQVFRQPLSSNIHHPAL